MTTDEPLHRALQILWLDPPARRTGGLSRERIVAAAIELADTDGLGALSMARLAERPRRGTRTGRMGVAPLPIGPQDCGTSITSIHGCCSPPPPARQRTPVSWPGW